MSPTAQAAARLNVWNARAVQVRSADQNKLVRPKEALQPTRDIPANRATGQEIACQHDEELNVRQSCRIPKTWLSGGALPPSRPKCATASEPCSLSKIPLRLAKADQIEQVGSVTSVHTQLLRDTGIKACHERGSVTLRQSELRK